jgi:hypothetical protein
MRQWRAVLAAFVATLASSQAIAGTYSSSQFSKVIAHEVLPNYDDFQLYFSIRA